MRYDKEKRVFLAKKFIELRNPTLVKRAWRTKYLNIKAPNYKTILNTASKFEKTGSINDLPRIQANPSNKRQEAKNQLKILYSENPSLSIRKGSSAVEVSYGTARSIIHDDLHLKPYKFQEWHKIELHNYQERVKFAEWFISQPKDSKDLFISADEAYFCLTESKNKQNNRLWLESRPQDWIQQPLHDQKVLVWCAISATKIYGPFYFERSVNQHNYLEMLKTFFWPKHLRTANYKNDYFQHDGATPHTANIVQEWLESKFGVRLVAKNRWPAQSPDLSPCDFFLWGYLKSVVYNPLPKTIDHLKQSIEREIKKINEELLKSTFLNLEKRCHLVIAAKGGHIEKK